MKNALKKTLCGIGSCAVVAGGLLYFRAHTEPSPLPVSEPPAAQSAVSEPESNSLTDTAKEDVETLIQDGENMSSSEVEELLEKIAAQEENAAGSEASAAASSSRPEGVPVQIPARLWSPVLLYRKARAHPLLLLSHSRTNATRRSKRW